MKIDPRLEITLEAGNTKRDKLLNEYYARLIEWTNNILFDRIETAHANGFNRIKITTDDLPSKPDGLSYKRPKGLKEVARHIKAINGLKVKKMIGKRRGKIIIAWSKKRIT